MNKKKRLDKKYRGFKKHTNTFMDQIDTGKATPEQKERGIIRKSHEDINHALYELAQIKKSLYQANKKKLPKHEIKQIKQFLYTLENRLFLRLSKGDQYSYSIESHLDGDYFLYHQNKPDTYRIMISLDFDRIKLIYNDDYLEDIIAIQERLNHYFHGSYWDLGSSGKSLNFFLYINISDYSLKFLSNSEISFNTSFPKYINMILSDISAILRFVFNTPTDYCQYNLEFDGIKGTMSDYDYTKNKKNTTYHKIINSGTLAKLPRPTSDEQHDRYINAPTYTLDTLVDWSIFLFFSSLFNTPDALFDTKTASGLYSKACRAVEHLQELGVIEKGNTVFPSLCSGKDSVLQSDPTPNNCLTSNNYSIDMAGPFPAKEENSEEIVNNPHKDISENKYQMYLYEDIQTENNALHRGRMALKYQMNECLLNGEEYPTVPEYRNYYRQHFGTDAEDEGDIKRLESTYHKYFERFKAEIENSIQSKLAYLEKEVQSVIPQERIIMIRNAESSFRKGIYHQDVAASALWIYYSLTNTKFREMKEFSGKHQTVPMSSLKGYLTKLKTMGLIKNGGSDDKKLRALRKILEYMGWIKVVVPQYSFVNHISMRYILKKRHPYYKSYEKIVGPEVIQCWEEFAENAKQSFEERA